MNQALGSKGLRVESQGLGSAPGLGPFLAFQYTIDLNYSARLDHDEYAA